MTPEPDLTHLFGGLLAGSGALLGGYLLLLKLREHFAEKPDPKLTYATRRDLDTLRQQLHELAAQTRKDTANVYALIHKNAEHIARLLAHTETSQQRLGELNVKSDRLLERVAALATQKP